VTDTLTTPRVSDPALEEDEPIFTHIVVVGEGESAEAVILEARVNGTPVTALCGYVWVPSRDPQRHPICQRCLDLFKASGIGA
jgi:hypothetical protein